MSSEVIGERPTPVVSVAMLAYNHEHYLAHAIESVLAQEVDFPIEIVVGEDCSADGTRRILMEFAGRYPTIVRPLLRPANIGMHANAASVLEACRGEFVALLEGDDYWTDPQKLQLQVDLLRADSTLVGCYHRVSNVVDTELGTPGSLSAPCPRPDHRLAFEDLLWGCIMPTCSVVYRRSAWDGYPDWLATLGGGDWGIFLLLAQKGDFGYLPRVLGAYRQHPTGAWTGLSRRNRIESVARSYLTFRKVFGRSTTAALRRGLCFHLARSVRHMEDCGDSPSEVRSALQTFMISAARLGHWPSPRDLWWWFRLRFPRAHRAFFLTTRASRSRRA